MNERIKELMLKSNPDGDFSDSEWVFEKFAELIVKECADVCEEYRGTKWGKAAECIGDSIREHFGVEE